MLVYPGSAKLAETESLCETDQREGTALPEPGSGRANLTMLVGKVLDNPDGTSKNVNVPTYEPVDILDLLDDLKFVDVSTVAGAGEAAQTFHTHSFKFDCKIFVEDQRKDVKVFGKQSD